MNPTRELHPRLLEFADKVESIFGKDLVSLCAFGEEKNETNLLLVLKQLGTEELRKLVEPVQTARKEVMLELLLFSPLDLHRSADAMPLRLLHVQKNRVLLKGEDVMANVFVEPEHVRIALEQETRITLLRLRQLYLTRAGLRPGCQETLCETLPNVMRLMGVALELTGQPVPSDTLLELAHRQVGIRPETFLKISMLQVNPERLELDELEKLYESYIEDVAKLVRFADKLSRV